MGKQWIFQKLLQLVFRMLGSLFVIVMAFNEDPELTLVATHNSADNWAIVDQGCTERCRFKDRRIECIDCIPRNLTSTVNEILLTKLNESRIVPYMFCGVLWPRVVNLTILNSDVNGKLFNVDNFTFSCLPQIEMLKLGLTGILSLDDNAFHGLENTSTLDLTNCIKLDIPMLTPSLSLYANLPKLQSLILRNFGSFSTTGVNQLSQTFVNILTHRKISYIDFSFSTVGFVNQYVNIQ